MIKVEIECPYCGKVHVHNINAVAEVKPKQQDDIDERELPHDEDTEDLENFRKED